MNAIDFKYHLITLAQEIELTDPIDWGMLSIDEDSTYDMIASNVLELFMDKYNQPEFKEMALATIIKLVVENFVLNLKTRSL